MASRILHGGVPSKGTDRKTSTLPRPSSGKKTLSGVSGGAAGATGSGTSATRLPQSSSTSFFGKSKGKAREKQPEKPVTTAAAVSVQQPRLPPAEAIQPSKSIGTSRTGLGTGVRMVAASNISRGLAPGMGTTTQISAAGSPPSSGTTLQPTRSLRRKPSFSSPHERYTRSENTNASAAAAAAAARGSPARQESTSPRGEGRDRLLSPGLDITISEPEGTTYTPISKPDYSTPTEYQTSNSRMELYMSRKLPHKLSTQNLPPPSTTSLGNSSSARDNSSTSSRFTETPSPFSRISTPNTAASSYSPSGTSGPPPKLTPPRLRPSTSPTKTRPPVVRRKMPGGTPVDEFATGLGLASVRENREASNQSSSSSSNSTIKASELLDNRSGKAILGGKLDRNPPPTAPLRVSSKRLPRPPLAGVSGTGVVNIAEMTEQTPQGTAERRQSRLPMSGVRSPPLRPSRQGAPPVENLEHDESPVIQSNLSHLATTGHTRRESREKNIMASPDRSESASPRRRLTKSPPKEASEPLSPQLRSASNSNPKQLPSLATEISRPSKRDQSPASATSTTRSRFGLFSRRIKSPEEPVPSSTTRKGPIAGTGHEAYGKFGRTTRTRSGSQSSSGSRGKSASPSGLPAGGKSRQSSFTSNDGARPDDGFLEQRLKPVVISGGGAIKTNRNSGGGLGASMYASSSAQSSLASIGSSVVYYTDRKATVTSSESSASMVSTAGDSRASRSLLPAPKLTAKTDSSRERTLAHRRSQQRISQGEQVVRIPAPINVPAAIAKPVLDSRDTAMSSIPDTGSLLSNDMSEGAGARSDNSKDRSKSRMKSPRRWNIFSRNRSRSPKKKPASKEPTSAPVQKSNPVNAAISDTGNRFVGHYAIMEDEEISTDDRDIEDVLRDIENSLDLRDEDGAIVTSAEEAPEPRQVSMLLPSPPKLNAEFPKLGPPIDLHTEPPVASEDAEQGVRRRPSRLQRVGRIPPEQTPHRPNQSSFSRPFDASSRPSLDGGPRPEQSPSRPKLTLQTDKLAPTKKVERWREATYATAPPTNAFLHNLDGEREFMSFSAERQSSQMSGSSSSGNASFMNMIAQRAAAQAVQQQQHGEVFNESDDHAEESFDLDSPEGEELLSAFPSLSNVRRTSPNISPESNEGGRLSGARQSESPRKSVSPPLPEKPDHLAIPPHLHPATQPHNKSTSSEISDFNRSSGHRRNRLSNSSSVSDSRYSSQTTISSSSHVSAYVPSQINQVTRAMARKTHSTRDSLRFSALMTSRWLSFDRVLFSPVAEDILSLSIQSPRILILDGLANDDWSAYTALSYPNATVYNLSTTPKLRTPSPHGDEWANPPNHKLLPLPSTAHPFPFPKGFFTAAVIRFPPLLPQHHLGNLISEAKRVLRPGGYLEMTLLDIDPVNLGPKTRREVKRVKMRAHERMPDAGLTPVSDATMKALNRRGFEGLRTAVLGVPVATSPSADSIQGPGSLPFNEERASDADTETPSRSLGDLLREAGDESGAGIASQYPVAQTISRVARWWWSRCYEGLASVDGNDERGTLLGLRGRGEEDSRSMWADPAVVEECEECETSLRLVLAYAVKPMVVRRRTVSV